MLKLALILVLAATVQAADISLLWDYPTEELGIDLTFKIYASANVATPLTNWSVLTNIVGTAATARVSMTPSRQFFYVTASNLWGESLPSNITNTPLIATNVTKLKITKP